LLTLFCFVSSQIVCCCRLSPEKNVELFVRCMCHPRVSAAMQARGVLPCLVGASVDPAYTSHLTRQLYAAHPDALCRDFMPAAQLAALFARACLYFHPALNEAFGMTIIEAAAFATPSLLNAHSIGAGELLTADHDAVKVDFANEDDIIEQLGWFLSFT
jgi:glycosyltransferase involved in cell wall biosynthesis